MLKQETIYIGEKPFIRTWSDKGMLIHGGEPESDYPEALDPEDLGRTYTETDIPIEGLSGEATDDEIDDLIGIIVEGES